LYFEVIRKRPGLKQKIVEKVLDSSIDVTAKDEVSVRNLVRNKGRPREDVGFPHGHRLEDDPLLRSMAEFKLLSSSLINKLPVVVKNSISEIFTMRLVFLNRHTFNNTVFMPQNLIFQRGRTALIYVVDKSSDEMLPYIVDFLIERGVNISERDNVSFLFSHLVTGDPFTLNPNTGCSAILRQQHSPSTSPAVQYDCIAP
jgi:hypothetical protein